MTLSDGPIERALARAVAARGRHNEAASSPIILQNSTDQPADIDPIPRDTTSTNDRRRVHVNKLSDRYAVTKWMKEEAGRNGERYIISKAVKKFPQFFTGNMKARLQKASRWWSQREATLSLKQEGRRGLITREAGGGVKRANFKAMHGRGRKRSKWASALYAELLSEFERLKSVGVKFSPAVLCSHARSLIREAKEDCDYHQGIQHNGKAILDYITIRWVQHFMTVNRIVLRAQTGKLLVSPEKELTIQKCVAFHLGELKRGFESGLLNENRIENADETHFVFNMDNGKTLGFKGDDHVKYADVVSGGDPITMMVRLTGGPDARIEAPMLIFKNENRSYPIRGVPDNIPGVCYRSQPKGWMDGELLLEWLSESRAIKPLPMRQHRVLYVDNCSSHNNNTHVRRQLQAIRTTMQKIPPNATHLLQPADSFIIQKIKDAWRSRWEDYKYECIKDGNWVDGINSSGKLPNPGKGFFLRLAADAVREVNAQRDKNGVQYARKAMIMTGMSLNLNGLWEESQLTQELQQIVAKHRNHFEGEAVEGVEM